MTAALKPFTLTNISLNKMLQVPPQLQGNAFVDKFCEDFAHGELKTPSFPSVALKIRKAVEQDCDINQLVKIINMDPVIAGKLIQVVNSPFYMLMSPINDCMSAINRLGRKTTRDLVITFSMKNMINSNKPLIKQHIQQAWLQSVKVSSISFTLAKLLERKDANEALLAGLLHNVGVLPILLFADAQPENSYRPADLALCLNSLCGQIGAFILEQWEFPDSLKRVPEQTSEWFTNSSAVLDLHDIVVLAKYHFYLQSPGIEKLPLIDTLPAYHKLDTQSLTPNMSLKILHEANQQIVDTVRFFSA